MFTSRDEIITLLTELGARLDSRGLEVELYIVGGAAMMLGYDRSSVTRDIDALITPGGVIDEVVEEMANERGNLPPDWLNSRVVPLLPRLADSRSWEMLHVPGLSVEVASAEHLLAMKARAGRSLRDLQDVAVLCEILELRFVDQVWQTCDRVWGGGMIRPEVRATITEFLVARGLTEE